MFDNVVKPALVNAGIEALRVDRVQHNKNINDKIIQLMDDADLCIADLTLARPSVYYEAGYISGAGKPVIYITRNDHFRQTDDDIHGNRTVHFDLRMKNIIGWQTNNRKIRTELALRIKHVTAPIRRMLAVKAESDEEREIFQRLPLAEQLDRLRKIASNLLRSRKFGRVKDEREIRFDRTTGGKVQKVDILVRRAFNKTDRIALFRWSIKPFRSPTLGKDVTELETLAVCISPYPIVRRAFRSYFVNFAESRDGALHRTYPISHDESGAQTTPHAVTIRLLDRVESEPDLRKRFGQLLSGSFG